MLRASNYWLGGNKGLSGTAWAWSDGSSFSYQHWAKGQPASGNDYQCLSGSLNDSQWYSASCYGARPYICKVPAVEDHCKPQPTPACPPQPSTPAARSLCETGWTYSNVTSKCYLMVGWLVWDDARSACARRYANLASIHSDAENDWITDFLHQNVGPTDNVAAAIGLYDTTGKCAYQWVDGSSVNYHNWGTGQPSNCGAGDWRRVLVVFNPDGYQGVAFRRWMSYPASWGIYAVCEKPPAP